MCSGCSFLICNPHCQKLLKAVSSPQFMMEASAITAAMLVGCRAYDQLKQQKEEEARAREAEKDLINLLRAEEVAERDRLRAKEHAARQAALRAEMLAATQEMLRLKVFHIPCTLIAVVLGTLRKSNVTS